MSKRTNSHISIKDFPVKKEHTWLDGGLNNGEVAVDSWKHYIRYHYVIISTDCGKWQDTATYNSFRLCCTLTTLSKSTRERTQTNSSIK